MNVRHQTNIGPMSRVFWDGSQRPRYLGFSFTREHFQSYWANDCIVIRIIIRIKAILSATLVRH